MADQQYSSMRTSDFDYHLPPGRIAQVPLEPRDSSRLMVLDRVSGRTEHRRFRDIVGYALPGDVMVFNQSRVIPARLHGRREDTGGKVQVLLLRRESPGVWHALAQPGRRLRPGTWIKVEPPPEQREQPSSQGHSSSQDRELKLEILETKPDGVKVVRFSGNEDIESFGQAPLPPYIHTPLHDPERYQTIYSRQPGSAAAPTAGLHFTQGLLEDLSARDVELAFVTLHVGLDTFRPVQVEDPAEHRVHSEYFELSSESADLINRAKQRGKRVIAVGTTSVRVLEYAASLSPAAEFHALEPTSGWADLFIFPGYRFRVVDALLTNFHLPKSSLLMLVSAFAGPEIILKTYQEAIDLQYRFYSFGDAMLIL